ncbi:hypothetical protein OO015_00635 [Thermomicrobium sp. 4228-Ro]|uniref:hypothetical protein n=1 Tax=Thermomicrobium sp. 4228-Ro TaxID=2993937 RepID=UPI0022495B2C|nr:hypothetical protein [Thermomicrobium sp. 4228-Ro]MCX2726013.1 hypothetical protein [Thermomicrobium sp. 4228-Ro]
MGRPRVDLEYTAFYPEIDSVTISSGSSISPGVDLDGLTLVGILMPDTWDGTSITFQASLNGTGWYDLYDAAGNEVTLTVGPARYIQIDPQRILGIRYLRIRSGTAATPVNQTANRTLQLVTRAIR